MLERVRRALARADLREISADEKQQAVVLSGRVQHWEDYIRAGYAAAGKGFRGVVNDIEVAGRPSPAIPFPRQTRADLEGKEFDVLIIGGGVIGCSIARELCRWQLKVALVEKE